MPQHRRAFHTARLLCLLVEKSFSVAAAGLPAMEQIPEQREAIQAEVLRIVALRVHHWSFVAEMMHLSSVELLKFVARMLRLPL